MHFTFSDKHRSSEPVTVNTRKLLISEDSINIYNAGDAYNLHEKYVYDSNEHEAAEVDVDREVEVKKMILLWMPATSIVAAPDNKRQFTDHDFSKCTQNKNRSVVNLLLNNTNLRKSFSQDTYFADSN